VVLDSFAAAAISRADPIRTGITAFWYSSRTAILPFMFIFNPQLLMIGIHSWWQLVLIVAAAIVAMLAFAGGTQGWFLARSRWYESVLLLIVTFTLLRPGFWLDWVYPTYDVVPPQKLMELASAAPPDTSLRLRIEGTTVEGKDVKKTVLLPLGESGSGPQRLTRAGLTTMSVPTGMQIAAVNLHTAADKAGFEQGFLVTGIETPAQRPAKEWMFVPALALLVGVALLQRRRAGGDDEDARSGTERIKFHASQRQR
jgi:hypothetical protein